MALRFLSLNINSYVCLRFQCSKSGEGTDGGEKTNSNRVLISYAQSMYSLLFCMFLFSVSLSVSQASLPPSISISMRIVFLSLSLLLSPFPHHHSLSLSYRLSISISMYPLILTGFFFFFFFVIYNERLLNGIEVLTKNVIYRF